MKIQFRRFTKPNVLKRINRELLEKFLDQFKNEFNGNARTLPPPDLPDEDYFNALSRLLMSPECLPDRLNEALFAIDEMSTPRAQEQLEAAAEWPAVQGLLRAESSAQEIALQVWFAAPGLLARVHNAQRLRRLTTFEYFSSGRALSASLSPTDLPTYPLTPPPFTQPAEPSFTALTASLDGWFARNQRGHETTRVEVYPLEGELWFLVRHGDVFTRAPKVEAQRTEILHFRPERDDVIVFCPEQDEIRINARTKGERELYREQFGLHLRGSADYFSRREAYTLEPLRADGALALTTHDIDGLGKIILREVEIAFDNGNHEVITTAADDLFGCFGLRPREASLIPNDGRLTRAVFEVEFTGTARPRPVEVRPPNVLKLGRGCDAVLVQRWLWARGFRNGK